MRRLETPGTVIIRAVIPAQLACLVIGTTLLLQLGTQVRGQILIELFAIALLAALVTVGGWMLLAREHRRSSDLARSMAEERLLTATLERAIASRTTQLDDADRVLRRMWWLGQQITLELNPRRVLERFLEAVADVAQAEGGIVGMVGDDGNIHVVVSTGISAGLTGAHAADHRFRHGSRRSVGSAAGPSPTSTRNADELADQIYERLKDEMMSLAIVPDRAPRRADRRGDGGRRRTPARLRRRTSSASRR